MPIDKPHLGESAPQLNMALRAAGMEAWEFDVATGNLAYSTMDIDQRIDNDRLAGELLEHIHRGASFYSAEFRREKPDGGVIWRRYQGEVIRAEDGRPSRVMGIAWDITERKEEDELLRSITAVVSVATGDAFFRLLVQRLCTVLKLDLTCISELDEHQAGNVRVFALLAGDKFSDDVEYQLSGTPCEQVLAGGPNAHPHNVQALFPLDHQLVEMGIESYVGIPLIGSTGHPLGLMSVMSRAPMQNVGSVEAILKMLAPRVASELERRRSERALRESEFRNRAILGALPDLIFVTDRQGLILDIYTKHPNELRVVNESIRGKRIDDVFAPEPARLILQSLTKSHSVEPALVEYSLSVLGEVNFYEARTVAFGDNKVLTIIRSITEKKRAEAELQDSQRFAQHIAETTPSVLFVYDLIERRNVYANDRALDVIGYTPKEIEEMGDSFIPQLLHPDDIASLPQIAKEYAKRRDGEVFENVFRMKHKNGQWRWVHRTATIFSRTPDGRPKHILGSVTDITRFKQAERDLQELSARLLNIQDEERRRIGRELHDVTGQNLTAIGLNLTVLERSPAIDPATRTIISECQKLCEESKKEIRTLSFLLHPPMLDQFGLVGALEWYVAGFKKRTQIDTVLDIEPDIERLPKEMETDLFRVIQEGLTNIMRYSGSQTAVIRLAKSEASLILQIEDQGHGMPARTRLDEEGRGVPSGVGIPAMRERLRQHGGSLEVSSGLQGTTVTAIVPLAMG